MQSLWDDTDSMFKIPTPFCPLGHETWQEPCQKKATDDYMPRECSLQMTEGLFCVKNNRARGKHNQYDQ